MERQAINLENITIDSLVEKGALHFQMETPTDSIYSTGPLADRLTQSFLANLNFYEDVEDTEKLARVVPKLIGEIVQNAIEHGNKLDNSKSIDGYFLWEEHPSGNAVMYVAVVDQGRGFDVNNYRIKNIKHGGEAIPWLKDTMDLVYNFGDAAIYAAKVIRRTDARQARIDKAA